MSSSAFHLSPAQRWNNLLGCVRACDDTTLSARLIGFLELPQIKSRLLTAPASTARRYHHAYEGGLLVHILEMFSLFDRMQDALRLKTVILPADGLSAYDQVVLCIILHDLHKIGSASGSAYYVTNILKSGKVSEAEPFAKNAEWLEPMTTSEPDIAIRQSLFLARLGLEEIADGSVSLSMVAAIDPKLFDALPEVVQSAIVHHDGKYGKASRSLMGQETPLQLVLHFIDMWNSRVPE